MPIMIPAEIPGAIRKSKEIIFQVFKSSAKRNWVVLHGITIPSYVGNSLPDFVILMPDLVSVICLKVIESDSVESPPGQIKDPLDLAKESMETLIKHSHVSNSHPPPFFGYAAVFIDREKFTVSLPSKSHVRSSDDLDAILEDYAIDMTGELWGNWEKMTQGDWECQHFPWEEAQEKLDRLRTEWVATGETITTIATIFHDNLETHRPQLLRLTDDQLEVLQLVGCQPPSSIPTESGDQIQSSEPAKDQPRVVVDGAAGTGKTVLAIEIARQRCEAGETVGLLCSNPYLSQRFEKWAETLYSPNGGKVIAGTPAKLPSWAFRENDRLTSKHQQRLDGSPYLEGSLKLGYLDDGWQQFIAETIEDLNTLEQGPVFDYLIVDEAQNLCDEMFLNLQNALLKDGLENGRWIMFGDFENQKIVSPKIGQNGKDSLKSFGSLNWKDETLQTNCRNTHEITEKTFKLVGIESPSMSGVYGPHVQIDYFESEKKLENTLDNLIRDWENRHFQSRQIILLSSGTGDEFNTERVYSGWRLLNIADEPSAGEDKTLKYSDVYDFQGLESDLAILVLPKTENMVKLAGSLTLPQEEHLRRVLYTGMSRAKAMLVIVADQGWEDILKRRELLFDTLISLQK